MSDDNTHSDDGQSDEFEEEFVKSKTQVKKEMLALQDLGTGLLNLSPIQLSQFNLSDTLRQAVEDCKRIKSNSALKRQKQFIGKLMRKEDIESIESKLNDIQNQQHREARQHHLVEAWRDKLIEKNTKNLEEFIDQYSHCDRQQLRQLVTKAQKEVGQDRPPVNTRKLFKFIRETISHQPQD